MFNGQAGLRVADTLAVHTSPYQTRLRTHDIPVHVLHSNHVPVVRYRLYGTWKNDSHNQHPQLIRKRADLIKMSKSLMKRISKENVKPLGRLMGKLTHNAPGYMFEYVSNAFVDYDINVLATSW